MWSIFNFSLNFLANEMILIRTKGVLRRKSTDRLVNNMVVTLVWNGGSNAFVSELFPFTCETT